MDYNHMGDLISSVRKSKNMTQKELADLLHVTDKAVSKWERGISCPDIGTLPALADILGISTDELLRCRGQAPAENRGAPTGRPCRSSGRSDSRWASPHWCFPCSGSWTAGRRPPCCPSASPASGSCSCRSNVIQLVIYSIIYPIKRDAAASRCVPFLGI